MSIKFGELEIPTKYFSLLMYPIIVFVVGDIIFDSFGNFDIKVAYQLPSNNVIDGASARYGYFAGQIAMIGAALGVFIYFLIDIKRNFTAKSCWKFLAAYVVLSLLMATSIWSGWILKISPRTYWFLGKEFFEAVLKSEPVPRFSNLNMFDAYNIFLRIMNLSVFLSVPALILGCLSSLGQKNFHSEIHWHDFEEIDGAHAIWRENKTPAQAIVYQLGKQADRIKRYLTMSSVLLVIVIIQLLLWMQLPAFVLPKDSQASYINLTRSISTFFGVNYVVLLCSYYVPPVIVLSHEIDRLAEQHLNAANETVTSKSVRAWQSKSGLILIDLKSYKIVAAILAPLFPGIIGTLLSAFGGK